MSFVVGLDRWWVSILPLSRRRRRRRREEQENRRPSWWVLICPLSRRRREDDNEARWSIGGGGSVVEDLCGRSVWRIGDGFESLVGFVSLRDGEHEVRGEERKKRKLKKKKTFPILLTRVYKTPIKIGNRTR